MGAKILISPSSFAAIDPAPLENLQMAGFEIVDNPFKRKLAKPELLKLLTPNVIGLIAGVETLDRDVLVKSHLRVISRVGSGVSNIDLTAAKELGIQVCSTPDGPTTAVAELTVGSLLSMLRLIPQMNQALHAGTWMKQVGIQLEGKTVAVIGFGRIGRRVAELLSSFRVKILAVDPFIQQDDAGDTFVRVSLENALPLADIISLHSSGEECILGAHQFSLMKKGVFLLNAGRGNLISEKALEANLESGKVAGAWLDTFTEEPYRGPLLKFPQVILTPHVGSYTSECRSKMESAAVENLLQALGRAVVEHT